MRLDEVHQGVTKNKKRRRVGRGPGSGHGKTSGRGHKGQGSRAGWSQHPTFQGGAMPLVRRVPKRGFNNKWGKRVVIVNVEDLENTFQAGDEVSPEILENTPLLGHQFDELKVLGNGELTKKLTVSAHRFSQSAAEKIEKAGGKVVRLPGPTPVEEKKKQAKAKAKD
ncbi:MAG: 50S ribosomal protein L15 [Planctomycetaceae bacterium]|nr:50S ribosomal protein L15 [Planctomycetaceae bacterium]